jgi:hypothetical protein
MAGASRIVRIRRTPLSAVLLAAMLVLGPTAALALAGDQPSAGSVRSAVAITPKHCVANPDLPDNSMTCTRATIYLWQGEDTLICVSWERHTFDDDTPVNEHTGEPLGAETDGGCRTEPLAAASWNGLSSVTLLPIVVTVVEFSCGDDGCGIHRSTDIPVSGTWTGVGPTTHQQTRTLTDAGCLAEFVNAKTRAARFSGGANGVPATDVPGPTIGDRTFINRPC